MIVHYQKMSDDEVKMNVFRQIKKFLQTDNFEILEEIIPCFVEHDESKNLCYKMFKTDELIMELESIYEHIEKLNK